MSKFNFHISIAILLTFCPVCVSCHKDTGKPTVAPTVKVKIIEVAEGSGEAQREYSGTVSSSETTTVSFQVAGTITELYVQEGQNVTKGQVLGKVRNGEYQNAYNIAHAQLAEAQDGYQRLKKLHDANALPEVKWVEMEQKLKQAQNMEEMAKRTLDDATLHSPVSGTITRKYADVGQSVMPVEPVFEIVSVNHLTIDVAVSENEISGFEVGEKAIVKFGTNGEELEGKISQKSVTADPLTRSYTVKVALPVKKGNILPGMIGSVIFEKSGKMQAAGHAASPVISLPSQAVVLNNDNRWFVWVVTDSVAERRFVTADELAPEGVFITSGLKPGDKVIVEGVRKVGTGSKVTY